MVLVDASTRYSHVALLESCNQVFNRVLQQILVLRDHFPNDPICSLRFDNAAEFQSQAFNSFCDSLNMNLQLTTPYMHHQNGAAESFIKRVQLIARPMLMHSNLPLAYWSYATLHASMLI